MAEAAETAKNCKAAKLQKTVNSAIRQPPRTANRGHMQKANTINTLTIIKNVMPSTRWG